MTSRSPAPVAAPDLAALTALYARHTPELSLPVTAQGRELEEAARAHLAMAERRATGEQLVKVSAAPDGGPIVEVITDDMPFLVAALLAAVMRAGGEVRRVLHPIVVVRRDQDGKLADVLTQADPDAPPAGALAESWMRIELAPLAVPTVDLEKQLFGVLRDVREIVTDAVPMCRRAAEVADELAVEPVSPGGTPEADVASLLRWLTDGHFTFLGYRHHVVGPDGTLRPDTSSGLGMLRDGSRGADVGSVPEEPDGQREPLVITRANAPGPLKPMHPYYLAVPSFDGEGRRTGEHRFLGMLTVPALYESVLDIPLVERRVRAAIHRAGFPLESYSGQQMLEVISGLPREELFSATEERLHDTAVGVLAVAELRAVRLFLRPDPFRRFLSCLVYLPRDHYTTSSRLAMADLLQRRLGGTSVEYTARVTESRLALVHFTVQTPSPDAVGYAGVDVAELQQELTEAVRTWDDRLLSEPGGAALAAELAGVQQAYKAAVEPKRAVEDLTRIAALAGPIDFAVRLCPADGPADRRFTLYLASTPATLTDVLPLLQQLGLDVLDERPSEFVRADGLRVHVYDFGIRLDDATRTALAQRPEADIERAFCSAFGAAWRGDVETDRFSALVLRAGLPWREVAVLRAYSRYARQIGGLYGAQYMADTLLDAPRCRPRPGRAVPRAVRPGAAAPRGRGRGGRRGRAHPDRRRHRPRRRPHPAHLPRDDHGYAAHQLVPRPLVLLVQDRPVAGARHARAPAEVRDLRVLAADRGRAPALRGRRTRWAPLVGPSAGLPHRDPRPGQGAGGEERRDRARRGQGRVHRPHTLARARRGGGLLPHLHLRAARRHRQPGQR